VAKFDWFGGEGGTLAEKVGKEQKGQDMRGTENEGKERGQKEMVGERDGPHKFWKMDTPYEVTLIVWL